MGGKSRKECLITKEEKREVDCNYRISFWSDKALKELKLMKDVKKKKRAFSDMLKIKRSNILVVTEHDTSVKDKEENWILLQSSLKRAYTRLQFHLGRCLIRIRVRVRVRFSQVMDTDLK